MHYAYEVDGKSKRDNCTTPLVLNTCGGFNESRHVLAYILRKPLTIFRVRGARFVQKKTQSVT
jgi:hypothetical protein